jgi:Protein of unknown function (DUF1593)
MPPDTFDGHPRALIISDIGNEPYDQMSLVRLLLYSNQIDIEALVASTSTWQKAAVHPEIMRAVIRAYGQVRVESPPACKGLAHGRGSGPARVHRPSRLGFSSYRTQPDVGRRAGHHSDGGTPGPASALDLHLGWRQYAGARSHASALHALASPSQHHYATWTGISGDRYYRDGAGADSPR